MFDPNVQVEWPDEEPTVVSKRIKSLIAVPGDKFVRHTRMHQKHSVDFIDGRSCTTGKPNLTSGSAYNKRVREHKELGALKLEKPKDFLREHWQHVYDAATTALTSVNGFIGPENPDWFKELWPYFKSAVKNAAMKYEPNCKVDLHSDLAYITSDEAMAVLPDALSRLQQLRNSINDGTHPLRDDVRKSLVKAWVMQFQGLAEIHNYEQHNRTFTKKEARKLLRGAADLCREQDVAFSVKFKHMPQFVQQTNPLRGGVFQMTATVRVEPKSHAWEGGNKKVTRVEYDMSRQRPGDPTRYMTSSSYHHSFNGIIEYMSENADYNATMEMLGDDPYE